MMLWNMVNVCRVIYTILSQSISFWKDSIYTNSFVCDSRIPDVTTFWPNGACAAIYIIFGCVPLPSSDKIKMSTENMRFYGKL